MSLLTGLDKLFSAAESPDKEQLICYLTVNEVGKKKQRTVCIAKKNNKYRIHKLKHTADRVGVITSKVWEVEEIKSLEILSDVSFCIDIAGKSFILTCSEAGQQQKFIKSFLQVLSICKLTPALVNVQQPSVESSKLPRESLSIAVNMKSVANSSTSFDIFDVLKDFNWKVNDFNEDLETKLRAELQALEAANIHSIIQSEEQANEVVYKLEMALTELSVIDNWLNHYTRILDNMGADVHQVELRNKSLQIASENQNFLLKDLEKIVNTLKIKGSIVETLKHESLDFPDGIIQCEEATTKLMSAIKTTFHDGYEKLEASKERIAIFQGHANDFAVRLSDHLINLYKSQTDAFLKDDSRISKKGVLILNGRGSIEEQNMHFRKLVNWLKNVDPRLYNTVQSKYAEEGGIVYAKEFHDLAEQFKIFHIPKKSDVQDDFLFASQTVSTLSAVVKGVGGKVSSKKFEPWRKATKFDDENKTSGLLPTASNLESANDERAAPDEVYKVINQVLDMVIPIVIREQNFVTEFYSLKSPTENTKGVRTSTWREKLSNVKEKVLLDVKTSKKLSELMGVMFKTVSEELVLMIALACKADASIALSMMCRTEEILKVYQNSAYFLVVALMTKIHQNLGEIFEKFIAEQIKAIEDTKVTAKKRNGILSFFRIFPIFVDRMEKMSSSTDLDCSSITKVTITKAYERIIKQMFETLDVLMKDVGNDVKFIDDREQVNVHIMVIGNMHFLFSETRARKVAALEPFVKQAKASYDQSLSSYCKVVLRKPLGKLMEYFEGVEKLLLTLPKEEVGYNLAFSKGVLKDVIKKYPLKEIRKGIEVLYRKVDKHFSEDFGQLLQVVWRGIQEEVVFELRKYEELIDKCYPDSGLRLEFSVEEVLLAFSELSLK